MLSVLVGLCVCFPAPSSVKTKKITHPAHIGRQTSTWFSAARALTFAGSVEESSPFSGAVLDTPGTRFWNPAPSWSGCYF